MDQNSHKTVVVLDHSPYFSNSCGQTIELETLRTKEGQFMSKSLWTCSVEAALEYHRMITDLFPTDKLLRFVVSDSVGRFITEEWSEDAMTLEKILPNLAQVGVPDATGDQSNCCILNGLSLSVESLIQCSKKQTASVKKKLKTVNSGRIVVITHLKQAEEIKMIEDHVNELIEGQNKIAASLGENFLPLTNVELCLINTYPLQGVEMKIPNRSLKKISEFLSSEFHSSRAGTYLTLKIHLLTQRHFDLASTTISGIPMKEEQNSGSTSANYDVELLHHKEIHDELFRCPSFFDSNIMAKREGYNTLTLKWCTPASKGGGTADFSNSTNSAHRATPVEVNSRPSACLTSFLLSGRTVLLELPKKSGLKTISHILTCHCGHIFIHSLYLGRIPVDEPPSISEGPGGRVTDYRLNQFGEFLKDCMLAPGEVSKTPVLAKISDLNHLTRITKYCPLTMGDSVIFNCATRFESLWNFMKKRTLIDADMYECKKVIFSFSQIEKNGEQFTSSAHQLQKLKGLKKEEQYKYVWNELEQYLRNYEHYSSSHHSILNCLLQCAGKPIEPFVKLDESTNNDTFIDENLTAKPMLNLKMPSKESVENFSIADNPESPPMSPPSWSTIPKRPKIEVDDEGTSSRTSMNLLELWTKKYQDDKLSTWKDFEARASAVSNKVELYVGRLDEDERKAIPTESGHEKRKRFDASKEMS